MRGVGLIAAGLLRANPGRLIVLVAGAISVALAASGILLAASTSLAIVQQTVAAGWRGTYDLLVRPADTPALTVDGQQLVPLDYLGFQTTGISREQWQRIAQLSDVEVAAPVAALGWVKNDSADVGLDLVDAEPGAVYQIDVKAVVAGTEAVNTSALFAPAPTGGGVPLIAGFMQAAEFEDAAGRKHTMIRLANLPATWGLVVGIDPEAEDQLIGLASFATGQYLRPGVSDLIDQATGRQAVGVPVLTAEGSPIPGELSVSVSLVEGLTPAQVEDALASEPITSQAEYETRIERIAALGRTIPVSSDSAALADLLLPVRHANVSLSAEGRLTGVEAPSGGLAIDNNVVLIPHLGTYRPAGGGESQLSLEPQGAWEELVDPQLDKARPPDWQRPSATFGGDSTVFREIEVSVPPAFKLVPIGTFDRQAISATSAAATNYVPLGIYADIPREMIEDANGQAVGGSVPVSINPAGINPLPPVGLTNLEAVEALRGERFIDAIRVRVAGITGYSAASIQKVESVARQILGVTGLHVDVVAGSSPVDVRVAVPGVGVMSERWTTLGTAARIVTGAEGLSGILLAAVGLVVAAYLAAFGVFLTAEQAAELEVLRRVGWRRRSIVGLLVTQATGLGALAAALSAGLVTVLAAASGSQIPAWAIAAMAALVLLAHLVAAGAATLIRRGRRRTPAASHGPRLSGARPIGMALSLAREDPVRAIVVVAALTLSLSVAGLVAAVEITSAGELRTTLLGQAVALRLAPYHLLAAAAALFAAGALTLDAALLAVERRLSLIGTLRAVGWRARDVRRLITAEVLAPAVMAGLLAAFVVSSAGIALQLGLLAVPLGLGILVAGAVVGAIAAQMPARVAMGASPAIAIRAEGASAAVSGVAPRQALLTIGALVVSVAVVAAGWGAGQAAAQAPIPFVPPTSPSLPTTAADILDDATALSAHSDRLPGSPSYDAALAYVRDELEEAGFASEMAAYLSRQPVFSDAKGDIVAADGIATIALAYDADAWDGESLSGPLTAADVRAESLLQTCAPGIVLVRVSGEDQALFASELQRRCRGSTAAVLAIQSDDPGWLAVTEAGVQVRLPVAHMLLASSPGTEPGASAPWLVASLDSTGPGATQSAAPTAVLIEVARLVAENQVELRVAVVSARDGAAASVFLERVASEPASPMFWLREMGGTAPAVIGTQAVDRPDPISARAGLLSIAAVDKDFDLWLERAGKLAGDPTSQALLQSLGYATRLVVTDQGFINLFPLAIGIDAAGIGEPVMEANPLSVAGTELDTADRLNPRALDQVATALLDVIKGDK